MFRFLLSRRWVLFFLFVAALGLACWRLGVWQFDRLEERRTENAIIERNLDAPAVPVTRVMHPDRPLPERQLYRKVTATGTYNVADETVVRYWTRDGQPGVEVLTPLRTASGSTVLVDRGWVPSSNDPTVHVDPPDPAPGRVTVTGWAVPDMTGEHDEVTPLHGEVRLVSSRGFAGTIRGPLLHGYISATDETPEPRRRLAPPEPPDLSDGPHFFYGLQWWFFGALAVGGFGYFAYAESRDRRRSG
ncbi:MAG: SURF1 family protein [Actinomycetota bacterium]|nr:SURF1 family protein [Actinomycetota bacterium]